MKKTWKMIMIILPLTILLIGCSNSATPKDSKNSVETPSMPVVETPVDSKEDLVDEKTFDMIMEESKEIGYQLEVSTEADLDGDGTKEIIVLKNYDDAMLGYDTSEYDLFVQDLEINVTGEMINPIFNIVDILKEDGFLEIAVSEEGPSADYKTTFFRYDGKNLKILAIIEGYYGVFPDSEQRGDVIIDGTGTVKTQSRGKILQTWYYDDVYELRVGDEFVHIEKDLYPMETKVTLLRELKTVQRREHHKEAFTLALGEKATIMETDNKSWVSIKNSQGEIGWFFLNDFHTIYDQEEELYATDYFDGLSMAD